MPLDPQVRAELDIMAEAGLPPANTVSPAQARANARLRPADPGPEVAKVEDRLVPGQEGMLTARMYTPEGNGPFPVLVWFHGGGWVQGDLDGTDGTARELASQANCVVVSVDYRLAPETKFPGPVEDCYAATHWVAENAKSFNGDPERIAVGGYSAGGNLAAVVSLMARDRHNPPLVFQLLVCPVVDRDFTTESYRRNSDGYGLTKDVMVWYWNHYLKDETDATNPYAAPLQAKDLSNLPPALVIGAEYDPLCDEAEAYAQSLKAAGVPTEYRCYDGMIHGFFAIISRLDKAKKALADTAYSLKTALAD